VGQREAELPVFGLRDRDGDGLRPQDGIEPAGLAHVGDLVERRQLLREGRGAELRQVQRDQQERVLRHRVQDVSAAIRRTGQVSPDAGEPQRGKEKQQISPARRQRERAFAERRPRRKER
jgi:hypothetical protein